MTIAIAYLYLVGVLQGDVQAIFRVPIPEGMVTCEIIVAAAHDPIYRPKIMNSFGIIELQGASCKDH